VILQNVKYPINFKLNFIGRYSSFYLSGLYSVFPTPKPLNIFWITSIPNRHSVILYPNIVFVAQILSYTPCFLEHHHIAAFNFCGKSRLLRVVLCGGAILFFQSIQFLICHFHCLCILPSFYHFES
jgi:hypothetical protein